MPGLRRVMPRASPARAPAGALHDPGRGRLRGDHGHRVHHLHDAVPERSVLLHAAGECCRSVRCKFFVDVGGQMFGGS